MPKVKNSTHNNTEMTLKRLRIIDDILQRSGHIPSRKELLKRVNARLKEPIGISTIDKDIRSLRDLLDNDKRGVVILRKNGSYQYSIKGFSYFTDHVWEEELCLFQLLMHTFSNRLDEQSNRLMRSLAYKLSGMCPSASSSTISGEQTPFMKIDPSVRHQWQLVPAIWMHVKNQTTCRLILPDSEGEPLSIDVSPYCLLEGNEDVWLIGLDMSENRGNNVIACRISNIQMLQESHKTFRDDSSIDQIMHHSNWTTHKCLDQTKTSILTWRKGIWQEELVKGGRQLQATEEAIRLSVASRSNLTLQPCEEGRMMMDMVNRIEKFAS